MFLKGGLHFKPKVGFVPGVDECASSYVEMNGSSSVIYIEDAEAISPWCGWVDSSPGSW